MQDVAAVQVTASIPLVKQVQTERESARTMRSVRHDAYRMELQSRHWVRVLRNLHTARILGPRLAPRATLITLQTQYNLSRVKQNAGWSKMLVDEVSDSSKAERV